MEQEALQRAFIDVMRRFGKAKKSTRFLNLSGAEFLILELLIRHMELEPESVGMYVSRLVSDSNASGPAVSRVLKLLEGKGYLERHADKADRRNTYIKITNEGKATWELAANQLRQFLHRVIDRLGHQEAAELISLWNRLVDAMDEVD